jgi:tagatose-6-phosphate ketose/aldose isomerase
MSRYTRAEILQQPELWPDTVERVKRWPFRASMQRGPVFLTGAGTSAYAAAAIEAGWEGTRAIPSTDLLVGCDSYFAHGGSLISLARSGDSPESVGVVDRLQRRHPGVTHYAITCNADGGLAHRLGDAALVLDPRSNDRSLVMTSSFSNLVLAGLCLHNLETVEAAISAVAERVTGSLSRMEDAAVEVAQADLTRVAVLASWPLMGLAQEACLKILEMTAGRVVALPETFLGLRHGPMSFLREDTLVLCWLSNDPQRRCYEEDLLCELRAKKLGRIVSVGPETAAAPELPDELRTPFEVVFAQLIGYQLSLRAGLDPDSPSPDGVITRVVQGVRLHG